MTTTKSKSTMTAQNKRFWALPKSEQRIAVAKDVIKQLSTPLFKATSGNYFKVTNLKGFIKEPPSKMDELLSLFKRKKVQCNVCGIGACFAGLVRLGDKVLSEDIFGINISNYDGGNSFEMRILLRKVFTSEQLTLIECAFERETIHEDNTTVLYQKKYKAAEFGRQYKLDKGRLIAIMKNIIKNKGTFKP